MKLDMLANSRLGIQAVKWSPEIFVGAGIGLMICGTAYVIKAALNSDEIIDKAKNDLDVIKKIENDVDEKEIRKHTFAVYKGAALALGKEFGPGFGMEILGILCMLKGYSDLNGRYIGAMAVGETYRNILMDYRGRVKDELGEDADRHFRFGTEKVQDAEVTSYDKDGNEKTKKKKEAEVVGDLGYSEYARFFDEGCPDWKKSPEYNLMFLKAKMAYANDLLKARAHIFLNEVYDMLGIPRTTIGQRVGWWYDVDDPNSFVDFGIYDITRGRNIDFVNGYEAVILLDFNVMGDVWKHI